MSTEQLIAGFVVSTVGFSVFLFGKKQQRPPQLIIGILMMVAPVVVRDTLWLYGSGVALLVALKIVLRYEE